MKIQSVAILGAGAVGCYVLWGLADKAAANSLQLGVVAFRASSEMSSLLSITSALALR